MPSKKQRKTVLTTIALTIDTKAKLKECLVNRQDSYENVILRLLRGITDIYVDFMLVDNELPQTHTVVFQLGTDPDSLYYFDGQKMSTIDIKEVQHLIKEPKPSIATLDLLDFKEYLTTKIGKDTPVTTEGIMSLIDAYRNEVATATGTNVLCPV